MRAPATGERWEVRGLLGAIVAVAVILAGVMPIALADETPASDVPCEIGDGQYKYDVEEDQWTPSDPGVELTIVEDADGEADSITVPEGWVIVCAKAGQDKEYPNARTADMDQAISHIVIAPKSTTSSSVDNSSSTSVDSTSTSVDGSSTTTEEATTTTEEATTTTEEATTTTGEATTTTGEATTTTGEATTTTGEAATSTVAPTRFYCDPETGDVEEIGPDHVEYDGETTYDDKEEAEEDPFCDISVGPTIVTTTPDEVDDEELPFTGIDSELMIALAVLFLALGAALLALTRRVETD